MVWFISSSLLLWWLLGLELGCFCWESILNPKLLPQYRGYFEEESGVLGELPHFEVQGWLFLQRAQERNGLETKGTNRLLWNVMANAT